MITFIPLINWFWMCIESLFATGSNKGRGALLIWVLCSDLILSYQVHQISGQEIITLNVIPDLLTALYMYGSYPETCLWPVSDGELIYLPLKTLCCIQYIISSHHHHCGSEPVEFHNNLFFSNWIPTNSRQRVRTNMPRYNNHHLLIDQFNTTVDTVWHIGVGLFPLAEGQAEGWNMEKCWLLVLATVTGLDSTSLMEIQIMVAFRFNVFLMFF